MKRGTKHAPFAFFVPWRNVEFTTRTSGELGEYLLKLGSALLGTPDITPDADICCDTGCRIQIQIQLENHNSHEKMKISDS